MIIVIINRAQSAKIEGFLFKWVILPAAGCAAEAWQ